MRRREEEGRGGKRREEEERDLVIEGRNVEGWRMTIRKR